MSFIQQFQSLDGNAQLSRRRALLGISLLALAACSRSNEATKTAHSNVAYYTCTMHPFVRSQDPKGKCPVCGMDLVPVAVSSASTIAVPTEQPGLVTITPERLQEIGVTTEILTKRSLTRTLRAPARVDANGTIVAQFLEDDVTLLSVGQKVTVSIPSAPQWKIDGAISFVAPRIDDQHRIMARIVASKEGHNLPPGLLVEVSGEVPMGERLTVSTEAVMPTGEKYIVFVDHGGGKLEPREIEVGLQCGGYNEVLAGLSEGDRVVSSANFLVDAESRIQGVLKTWGDRP